MTTRFLPDSIATTDAPFGAVLQHGLSARYRARTRRFSTGYGIKVNHSSTGEKQRRKSESSTSLQQSPVQTILRELKQRMKSQMSIIPEHYAQFILFRCIPAYIPEVDHDILRNWLYAPILVTNDELGHILDIELSTFKSPKLSCSSVCYFRSWTMYAWQLQVVIEDLCSQGFSNELLDEWLFMLQACSRDTTVTPRYVGTTSSPSNPWLRTQAQPKRPNSIKGAFIDSLVFLFPEVAATHKIFAIASTETIDIVYNLCIAEGKKSVVNATKCLVDQIEKAMIGFFHPKTLLNCQSGGKMPMAGSHPLDEIAFLRCNTSLLATCRDLPLMFGRKKTSKFWQLCARGDTVAPTRTYLESCIAQAVPLQISSSALGVICAEEAPLRTMKDASTFWDAERVSSKLVSVIFQSNAVMEQGTSCEDRGSLDMVRRLKSSIGFSQLYNWPGGTISQRDLSAKVLLSWLRIVSPIVSITFGKITSAWVCHRKKTPVAHLLQECGIARIVNHDSGTISPTIVIPHLHPGYFARTYQTAGMQRVVWLSRAITWVYLDSAAKTINLSEHHQWGRAEFCNRVQKLAGSLLEQSGLRRNLQEAKALLETSWSKNSVARTEEWVAESNKRLRETVFSLHEEKRSGMLEKHEMKRRRLLNNHDSGSSTLPGRCKFTQSPESEKSATLEDSKTVPQFIEYEYLASLERFGLLCEGSHSNERLQQANQLYGSCLWQQYGEMNKHEWNNFLLEQPDMYYLAACLESIERPQAMAPGKHRWLQHSACRSRETAMLQDFAARRSLVQEISELMMNNQARWLQDSHKRGQKLNDQRPPVPELNGSNVHINQHGLIIIKYQQDGKETSVGLKLGSSVVPLNYLDQRTIHFMEGGLDIRNSQGQSLRGKCSTRAATIPVESFSQYGKGLDLAALWSKITGLPHPALQYPGAEAEDVIMPGQPMPSKMPQTPPSLPLENDALWLLWHFLDQNLPSGGEFWTGTRDLYPMRSTDAVGIDDFLRFLRLPHVALHPYASTWSRILTSKNCSALRTSLQILRPTTVRRQNAPRSKVPEGQKTLRCIIYDLGLERDWGGGRD